MGKQLGGRDDLIDVAATVLPFLLAIVLKALFRARHPQGDSGKCSYSKLLREEKHLSAAEGRVDKSCRGQQPEAPDCGWAALRTEVRAPF